MSSSDSPDAGGTDSGLRRRAGKEPERPNFAEICNLLSQYLKQRGALGVASKLEAANKAISESSMAAPATRTNLLPNRVKSPDLDAEPSSSPNLKSMDFFAKLAGPSMEGAVRKAEFRKPADRDPATAQLTIFYAGKVVVYNDFPAGKAKDIMGEAEKHANSYCVSRTPEVAKIKFSSATVSVPEIKKPAKMGQPQPNGSDLPIPIATRSSLHRFFSKRKDRVAAKAPYQVNGHGNARRPEAGQGSDPWPDVEILEAQSSKQPEPAEVEMLEGQSSKQHIDLNL